MTDRRGITAALRAGGIIDITTTGRTSGEPRRIEIVFFDVDGRVYITGAPGHARLDGQPQRRPAPHLPPQEAASRPTCPRRARIVTDEAERRPVLERACEAWNRQAQVEAFVAGSPLIEVHLRGPGPAFSLTRLAWGHGTLEAPPRGPHHLTRSHELTRQHADVGSRFPAAIDRGAGQERAAAGPGRAAEASADVARCGCCSGPGRGRDDAGPRRRLRRSGRAAGAIPERGLRRRGAIDVRSALPGAVTRRDRWAVRLLSRGRARRTLVS